MSALGFFFEEIIMRGVTVLEIAAILVSLLYVIKEYFNLF